MSDRPNLGTIEQYAIKRGVHTQTVRLWVRRGYFPIYKLPGLRAGLIDADEADAALDALPPGTIKPGYGSYGSDAVVRTLGGAR